MMSLVGLESFVQLNIPKGNPTAPQPLDEAQPAATKSLNEHNQSA